MPVTEAICINGSIKTICIAVDFWKHCEQLVCMRYAQNKLHAFASTSPLILNTLK